MHDEMMKSDVDEDEVRQNVGPDPKDDRDIHKQLKDMDRPPDYESSVEDDFDKFETGHNEWEDPDYYDNEVPVDVQFPDNNNQYDTTENISPKMKAEYEKIEERDGNTFSEYINDTIKHQKACEDNPHYDKAVTEER